MKQKRGGAGRPVWKRRGRQKARTPGRGSVDIFAGGPPVSGASAAFQAACLLPSLAGVTVFVLIPFADVVRRSFLTAVTEEPAGLSNYLTVLRNDAFRLAAGNTLRFVAACLPILILLGLVIAWCLARFLSARFAGFLKAAFLFPMAIPSAAVVLVWKMVFAPGGFFNLFLTRMSFAAGSASQYRIDYMGSQRAFWVLVASYIWKNLGYTVVLWLAGIRAVPEEIREAARVDGAGAVRCFFLVELPNLKPALYTITVLSFLNTFKVFRETYLVAGSYPDESIYLLQHMFNNWFVNLEFDRMAAAAVIVACVLMVFIRLLMVWLEGAK